MSGRPPHDLMGEAARQHSAGAIITAEYEGMSYSFREDGWFNATEAAKRYGKQPSDWFALDETRDYIVALNSFSNASQNGIWHQARRGNNGGTWMHPKLAIPFARWLELRFAVWCDMQIEKILAGKLESEKPTRLSTFKERRILHDSALDMVGSTGMLISSAHKINNALANTKHYNQITVDKIDVTVELSLRFSSGAATSQEHALLDKRMQEIFGESSQLLLGFDE